MLQLALTIFVPLGVIALWLILIPERYMSHHQNNAGKGKTYVWTERFVPTLAELTTELEDEFGLSSVLDRVADRAEIDDGNPESLSRRYSDEVEEIISYTKDLRDLAEELATDAQKLTDLEEGPNLIVQHRKSMGYKLLLADVVFIATPALYDWGVSWPYYLYPILFIVPVGLLFYDDFKRHNMIREEISEYAQKHEENRNP